MSPAPSTHGDDALGALALDIEARVSAGASLDPESLAAIHGVSPADVRDMVAAIEAVGDALFEPIAPADDATEIEIAPPSLPDDYELLGELGRGGMGIVYRARQKSLGREVAVKVLRPGELTFSRMLRRFEQEAKSLAQLKHPHIVSIHEVGRTDGCVFFTMDLVEGRPLSSLIAEHELTPTEAVRILRQVASAISYTHGHGVIHRDLKPANILVDAERRAFVVDFGLARDLNRADTLTRTGQVIGTANYMSPEQARGDSARVGEASDIYALGAVLYECLTGKPPFHGKGLADLMTAILHEAPIPPGKLEPRVPKALETICLEAMAKAPERRYPTARALLEDLERFEEGRTIRAKPPGITARLAGAWQRHWRLVSVGAGSAVAAALILLAVLLPQTGETPEALLESARNAGREGDHRSAATLAARAMLLEGVRLRETEQEQTSLAPRRRASRRIGPRARRAVGAWMYHREEEVRALYAADRKAEALAAATRAAVDFRAMDAQLPGSLALRRLMEVTWVGALAAADLSDPSAPRRVAELYRIQGEAGPTASHTHLRVIEMHHLAWPRQRLRGELVEILGDETHRHHALARQLLTALLLTQRGRHEMLERWRTPSRPQGFHPNPLDVVPDIVRGAVADAAGRPAKGKAPRTKDRVDETWFRVETIGAHDIWRDLRDMLRRMSQIEARTVRDALRDLAEATAEDPIVRDWATGLLAQACDLPPFWLRDRPPPQGDAETAEKIRQLSRFAETEDGRSFLARRVDAAIEGMPTRHTGWTEVDHARSHWLRWHLGNDVDKPGVLLVPGAPFPTVTIDWPHWRKTRYQGHPEPHLRKMAGRQGKTDLSTPEALVRALVESPSPSDLYHHLLICTAPGDVHDRLWAISEFERRRPSRSPGDESAYSTWRRHPGVDSLVPAVLATRVVRLEDGRPALQRADRGLPILEGAPRSRFVGTTFRVHGIWHAARTWPDHVSVLQGRPGLAGLTYHTRRRLISEPGVADAILRGAIGLLPDRNGHLALDVSHMSVSEGSPHDSPWVRVDAAHRLRDDVPVVLRFERRPSLGRASSSQSATLIARASLGADDGARLLTADAALDALNRNTVSYTGKRAWLRILTLVPLSASQRVALSAIRETGGDRRWDKASRQALPVAEGIIGTPGGLRWIAEAPYSEIEAGLVALGVSTPLARLESWQRVLRHRDARAAVVAWEAILELAQVAPEIVRDDHLQGIWLSLVPDAMGRAWQSGFGERVREARAAFSAARPRAFRQGFPIVVVGIGCLGLLLLVVSAWGLRAGRAPWRGFLTLIFGWVLAGQLIFLLPDNDLYVNLLGSLLLCLSAWLSHGGGRGRYRTVTALAFSVAFLASCVERMGGDAEVFGRIAILATGLGLMSLAFRLDRLPGRGRNRGRRVVVGVAAVLLLPTAIFGCVLGPLPEPHQLTHGYTHVSKIIAGASVTLAHMLGVLCVLAVALWSTLRAPRAMRAGN